MANASWPGSLPQFVNETGYREAYQDNLRETPVEVGPAKMRRRFTKPLRTFEISMNMTAAQVSTFEGFWLTTLKNGSLPFDWVHPRTQTGMTFWFRDPAPKITPVGAGAYSIVQFKIEGL